MNGVSAGWVAEAAGGAIISGEATAAGPARAVTDNRDAGPGDLFAGLLGERADGGEFAPQALAAGAWGALVSKRHAERTVASAPAGAVVIEVFDPLAALQALARTWRHELGAQVIGITGSTGKTSTKDILAALAGSTRSTYANRENRNTEIGLPLTILEADRATEVLVLEMAMRGEGQIAELTAIADPDAGVIVNVGPVHLELLGTVERVAAAKAELIRDLRPGAVCIVPAGEPLLDAHLRDDLDTASFGPGGDFSLLRFEGGVAEIDARGEPVAIAVPFEEAHNVTNAVAAVAVASLLGIAIPERLEVAFSAMRGEVVELPGGVTVVNDCYNANPMSMLAALEHLAESPADRRIALLGTMAELGPESLQFHREIGEHAASLGIDVLVTVGEEALAYTEGFGGETYATGDAEEAAGVLEEIAAPGDRVLVKGSRSVGLEHVLGGGS